MTVSLYCLVGWCVWAILLVSGIGIARVAQVLLGKKRSNEFPSGMQHGSDVYWRLNRAHINAVENLPIFAALILVAHLAHVNLQTLAEVALGARLVQSLVHLSSNHVMAVNLRFTAFVTQATCFMAMAVKLLMR
jgi:uncharacterized MAPEG superfamily protein